MADGMGPTAQRNAPVPSAMPREKARRKIKRVVKGTIALLVILAGYLAFWGPNALAAVTVYSTSNGGAGAFSAAAGNLLVCETGGQGNVALPPTTPNIGSDGYGAYAGPYTDWDTGSPTSGNPLAMGWAIASTTAANSYYCNPSPDYNQDFEVQYTGVGSFTSVTEDVTVCTTGTTCSVSIASTSGDLVVIGIASTGGITGCSGFTQSGINAGHYSEAIYETVATGSTTASTCTAASGSQGLVELDFNTGGGGGGSTTTTTSGGGGGGGVSCTTPGSPCYVIVESSSTTTTTSGSTTTTASTTTTTACGYSSAHPCYNTIPTTTTTTDIDGGSNPTVGSSSSSNCDFWDPECWFAWLFEPSTSAVNTFNSDLNTSGISSFGGGVESLASSSVSVINDAQYLGDSGAYSGGGGDGIEGVDIPTIPGEDSGTGFCVPSIGDGSGVTVSTGFTGIANPGCWLFGALSSVANNSLLGTVVSVIKDGLTLFLVVMFVIGSVHIIREMFASGH